MKIERKLFFAGVISLVIFILILMNISSNGFLSELDLSLNSMNFQKNIFMIDFSKVIDLVFDTWSIIIISLFLSVFFCFKFSKKEGAFFSGAILLNAAIIYLIKEIIHKGRPINMLIPNSSFAFPSGHTATAVVFFGLLIYLIYEKNKSKKVKLFSILVFMIIILIIGFTRLYLNLHWFSDVLGGFFLGVFVLCSCIILKEIKLKKI